ncbi:MAG: hypothetical protein IPH88_07790 [Bacteroidales bacterium]|nr:hypothetical protein [Bacteroidales bacterium]
MKLIVTTCMALLLVMLSQLGFSQITSVQPSLVRQGVYLGETPPLRELPALTPAEMEKLAKKKEEGKSEINERLQYRSYPFAETALPKGPDQAWQRSMGTKSTMANAPIQNFSGQTSSSYPPDCNGAVGPNHFMQTVNVTYAIYNKTGSLLAGPTALNTLFSGVTGSTYNDGDPIVLYDEQAQRFLVAEFSISGSNDYMLIAVSATSDPTGTWYKYSFDVADMPDYPKFGIWQDGYYMADNNSSGNDIYVFQRSVMLTGGASPSMIAFDNPNRPTSIDGFMCVPPVDNDGTFAPTGAPGIFIAFNDDAIGGGSDQIWIYELAANWTTPSSSTFARTQQLAVTAFDSNFGTDWYNISQPGTTMQLDAIPQVMMNVPQYRNFGTYQTLVCCHAVDVDATDHAGLRWYELRRGTQASGNWAIRQQGTYAPDANSRWMGSIMLNGSGKIGMGYSISSSTVYPGIRYTGQSAAAYAAGSGVMDIPEETIQTGSFSQTSYERWGDYSLLSVDPNDDQTFWYTTEYMASSSSHATKIASFKLGNAPVVTTLAATAVTGTSATINGTVNPNGLATTYNFEYGTTTSYGYTTTVTSAGSGTAAVSVSANLTGLIGGTPYHYRIVATNTDGTSTGTDLTFTPGAAIVTTTAISAITMATATSGGNVTTDGGSAVTARGVCWALTASPIVSGSHTTDGSGTGTFTSSITGLSSNSVYHVRAYATNSSGTFYGNDITFTTLCGVVNTFPWNEGFENGGAIPNCWSQEQVNSSGLNWTFITGNGGTAPATAHGGTYNACLKDLNAGDNITKLITPSLNLTGVGSPTLTFWHYQKVWSTDQDQLLVYYKTSIGGTWTLLASYTASVATWTQRTISLPNGSGDYYIAFEGNAKYGYGVCVDDVAVTGVTSPTLAVSPSVQNVTPPAGSTAFTVTSNTSWTTSSNQAWCVPTASGSNNGTITATYTQNGTAAARSATITVSAAGATPVTVTVTQAAPTLAVTPSTQSVTAASGTAAYTVTSNAAWTATSDQAWCTVTPSGTGNGTVTATYSQNSTASARTANVTVTVAGLSPITVTLSQSAPTLSVTPSVQNVSSDAGSTAFSVTSNSSWTASSDQTWCTINTSGTGNGTITATYTQNTNLAVRSAIITVNVTGLTSVQVTVTQAAFVPTLAVSPSNQNVTSAAGSTSFTVTSNAAWTTSSNQAWCVPTASGNGNGTITATYSENTSYSTRVATITVSATGATSVAVTVTQAGATPPEFLYTIANDVQTSPTTFEFDLLLLDNDATLPFELATVQAGVLMNPAVYNGGTVTASIVAGSSTLNASQQPSSVTYTQSANIIKLAAKAPPGTGNGSILSTNPAAPSRLCRIKMTNSVPWAQSQPNLTFCFTTTPYPTKISQYIAGINTPMSTNLSNCYSVCANNVLNPPPALNVTPSNQTVTAVAGSTSFAVSCNSNWTVVSDQAWCTVSAGTYGNGTITATYTANATSSQRIANITVSVIGLPSQVVTVTQNGLSNKTLNLTAFLEGLYAGNGEMNPAMDESGIHWGATIADKITIELHDASNYSSLIYSASNVDLNTDGTASITLPSSNSGSYYITIRHRNSIETVSATAVSFAGSTISYSFDNASKAFGGNMLQKADGTWVIYGGDANQDGLVDSSDMLMVDNDASNFVTGYIQSDINGDGLADSGDMIILDNNASNFIATVIP